ncbi:E3 ubiquitin-protein ligase RNFT1 [Trifolium repens]|nr:E3 ubiquitin-protein ligase RNFT1 [Trifolium repens]
MRQVAMAFKCILLIYYKKGKGHNFRRQAQMLTLGILTTGLYLTFKLTSVVEKVQCFISALKALSRKEVHYGVYATAEQVTAADCVSEWFERERTCPLCRALVKAADLRTFGDGSTSLFFQLF